MSNELGIFDDKTGMLSITDDEMEAEFKVATRSALEGMKVAFLFYGYTIETRIAVDVVQSMNDRRTYH